MRHILPSAALVLALAGLPALAQQAGDEHAGHHPESTGQGAEGTSAKPMANPLAANMRRIQALMARIQAEQDEAVRATLLGEHLQAMREQMNMMLAMKAGHGGAEGAAPDAHAGHGAQDSKGSGGEGSAGAGDMMKGGKGMMGGGMMMQKHEQMEGRVRMLELMLQQMLERAAVEAGHDH